MWSERAIENAWNNKTYEWIVWPYQTSILNRWVVLVINVKNGKSSIHTASQDTHHAKAEKSEIENFLGGLKDFNFCDENPVLDTDDGLNEKDELGSAYLAICYVKTVLEQIEKGIYDYGISASDFDELEADGKSLLKKVEEEYGNILIQVREIDQLEKHDDYDQIKTDLSKWTTAFPEVKDANDLKEEVAKWNADLKGDDLSSEALVKIHAIYQRLVDEWNTDFFSDFDLKRLSVNSLKAVKAKLEELKSKSSQTDRVERLQTQVQNLQTQLTALQEEIKTEALIEVPLKKN